MVTVYTRQRCGLCRRAETVVRRSARGRAEVRLVDIDAVPSVTQRYTLRVPVVTVDDREVAEYEVDAKSLRAALRAARWSRR